MTSPKGPDGLSIGTPLSTHGPSRALRIAFGALGALVLGAGLLMLAALGNVKAADRGTVLAVAGGASLLGAGLLAAALLKGSGRRWVLGSEGVRMESREDARDFRFADLVETAQMYRAGVSVGLAFRTRDGEWNSVSAHLSGYRAFLDGFMDGYLRHALPRAEAAVRGGGTLSFRMLTPAGRAQAALATGIAAYVQLPTEAVRVDAEALVAGEQRLPLAELAGVEGSLLSGRLSLLRRGGGALDLPASAVFEPELLVELLARLADDAAAA